MCFYLPQFVLPIHKHSYLLFHESSLVVVCIFLLVVNFFIVFSYIIIIINFIIVLLLLFVYWFNVKISVYVALSFPRMNEIMISECKTSSAVVSRKKEITHTSYTCNLLLDSSLNAHIRYKRIYVWWYEKIFFIIVSVKRVLYMTRPWWLNGCVSCSNKRFFYEVGLCEANLLKKHFTFERYKKNFVSF